MTDAQMQEFAALDRDAQILRWQETKRSLDAAQAAERAMRDHIVGSVDGVDPNKVGTQNVDLGNGWKLKAVISDVYRLDTDNEKVETVLDTLEDWQADRLVKWSARLMKSEYDQLDDAAKSQVAGIVTIKRGAPTLSLVPPKGT